MQRVELPQRLQPVAAPEDDARRARRSDSSRWTSRSNSASPPSRPRAKSSAASTATSRPPSPRRSASSATPASTSARSQCLTITTNGDEADLRSRLSAPATNLDQALYVSEPLPQTGRVMVKDEDVCVHCGLCAERCPTAAWDMAAVRPRDPLRRIANFIAGASRPAARAGRYDGRRRSSASVERRVNDFAIKLANVNGTGSASANSLLMQAIFRMGIPVSGKNLFPSNIQGLPDLVRDPGQQGRATRRARSTTTSWSR